MSFIMAAGLQAAKEEKLTLTFKKVNEKFYGTFLKSHPYTEHPDFGTKYYPSTRNQDSLEKNVWFRPGAGNLQGETRALGSATR